MLKNILLVGLGGALGSMLRYGTSLLVSTKYFPYSTLAVNITGSFIIGLIFALSIKEEGFLNSWGLFLATGVCGGFTTFSAFSLENMGLLQNGKYLMSIAYIAISIIGGISATWVGYKLVQ
jgi:CrcB protein